MTWQEILLTGVVGIAAAFLVGVQILCWIYGFKRSRATGNDFWTSIQEGAATATGNSYIVHLCKGAR